MGDLAGRFRRLSPAPEPGPGALAPRRLNPVLLGALSPRLLNPVLARSRRGGASRPRLSPSLSWSRG